GLSQTLRPQRPSVTSRPSQPYLSLIARGRPRVSFMAPHPISTNRQRQPWVRWRSKGSALFLQEDVFHHVPHEVPAEPTCAGRQQLQKRRVHLPPIVRPRDDELIEGHYQRDANPHQQHPSPRP